MAGSRVVKMMVLVISLGVAFTPAVVASDPDMLQDVCVADLSAGAKGNGYPCMEAVTAESFFFAGLANAGVVNNSVGSVVTAANVQKVAGLNTQGISMSRIDYAPGGVNPPHLHPRASEVVFVLEGELEVGFITTANVLVSKTIRKGDMFVFPRALVHYQRNLGTAPASLLVAFNSQLPGTQSIAAALFGANPPVPDQVLGRAFQVGAKHVQRIKSKFVPKS